MTVPAFALVLEDPPSLTFRPTNPEAAALFEQRPDLSSVVRSFSAIYRGTRIDACTAYVVARDLQEALRSVSRTRELTVRPMTYVQRKTVESKDLRTGRTFVVVEQELVDLADIER